MQGKRKHIARRGEALRRVKEGVLQDGERHYAGQKKAYCKTGKGILQYRRQHGGTRTVRQRQKRMAKFCR